VIYTRLGDDGLTMDFTGQKLPKSSGIINLTGALDELSSHLGLIKAMLSHVDAWQYSWRTACVFIEKIQKDLMKLMSHASDIKNEKYLLCENDVVSVEKEIDKLAKNFPSPASFVIPGKNIIEAQIQIARTVARRAERCFFAVREEFSLCPYAGNFLNRLSDYLFALSQQESLVNVNFINQITGV